MRWNDKRYHSLDYEMKKRFGEKIYRISIDGGMSCPNRNSRDNSGGCIFCSAGGSGDFASDRSLSITEQINKGRAQSSKKADCSHFIAYFQAYTNTYAPIDYLKRIFTEAVSHPDIVALSIATRPDCLGEDVLDLLEELNQIKPVWVELGLQTIHEKTAEYIRRGFSLECYATAVQKLYSRQLEVITHVILGLPGESEDDMLATVNYVGHLPVSGIKLQLLHILKGTALYNDYVTHPFPVFTRDSYCKLIVRCLEILPPHMVIHRLTGDGPKELLEAPQWSTDKKRVLNEINHLLKVQNTWQGKCFKP